jgi:hypothetical protein
MLKGSASAYTQNLICTSVSTSEGEAKGFIIRVSVREEVKTGVRYKLKTSPTIQIATKIIN